MGKVETIKTSLAGGVAEVDRATTGAERGEAPYIKTPNAKAPPTAPAVPADDRLARSAAVPIWRRPPSLRTSLMVAGIVAVVIGSAVFWLRGGRYASTDDAYVQAVGGSIANLTVDLHARRWRRERHGRDNLVCLQRRLDLRCVSGQAMELCDRNNPAFSLCINCLHAGVERSHRNRHVGWICGYALVAGAEDGVDSVEAAERRTARAGIALVARLGDIIEIIATRPLQQIAAGGGFVP